MEVKDLLDKEYALRHTKLVEDFEQGQPEMFSPEEASGLTSDDLNDIKEKYRDLGRQLADKYTSKIGYDVEMALQDLYKSRNIDLDAQAQSGGFESSDEMVGESDAQMESIIDVGQAFIDGFSENWFFPLVEEQ